MKKTTIQKIIAIAALLAVWQIVALIVDQRAILASPIQVITRLFTIWQEPMFAGSIAFTFIRIAGGFVLAFLIGVALAILAGSLRWIEILLSPVMVTIKSVPVASFIIIALVWLSSRSLSIFISFLMVLPVIYNNVLGGIKNIDPKLTQMADVYDVSFKKRFKYIWIPAIKPFLLSALTTALGLAWKAGIAAEVIGIPDGSIGEQLYFAKAYLNTTDLFAWTVIIVLISVIFEKIVLWVVKKILK